MHGVRSFSATPSIGDKFSPLVVEPAACSACIEQELMGYLRASTPIAKTPCRSGNIDSFPDRVGVVLAKLRQMKAPVTDGKGRDGGRHKTLLSSG